MGIDTKIETFGGAACRLGRSRAAPVVHLYSFGPLVWTETGPPRYGYVDAVACLLLILLIQETLDSSMMDVWLEIELVVLDIADFSGL